MRPFLSIASLLFLISCTGSKDVQIDMEQIQLESDGCYSTCPVFTLIVQRNGAGYYDARRYNPQQGQFTAIIKKPQLDSLLQLINNTNYFSLNNTYLAGVSDVVEYKSTLTLQAGSSKTITDHGPSGPASLQALYTFMLSLRTSQDWR